MIWLNELEVPAEEPQHEEPGAGWHPQGLPPAALAYWSLTICRMLSEFVSFNCNLPHSIICM